MEGKVTLVAACIDADLRQTLSELAEKNDRSVSAEIRRAIRAYLGGSSETRNACIHAALRTLLPVVYPNFSHFLPQPHVLCGISLGVCESTRLFLDFLDVREGFPRRGKAPRQASPEGTCRPG